MKITETNTEDPITIEDMPPELLDFLEDEFHAEVQDSKQPPLPYIYVDIPKVVENPQSLIRKRGRPAKSFIENLGYKRVRIFKEFVERCGWFVIPDGLPLEERDDVVVYCISPYPNPHEPGLDEFDDIIDKAAGGQDEDEDEEEDSYEVVDDEEV